MMMIVIATMQAVVMPAPSNVTAPAEPLIWRDIRKGTTPEGFAAALRTIDGIKTVEVTRKGTKPAKVKISYASPAGITIGDITVFVTPTFVANGLSSITLTQTGCYAAMNVNVEKLTTALGEKYPHTQRVRVVDEDGVSTGTQRAFYNDETRVSVSVTPIPNPYPQHAYGGSGFAAAANQIANALADSEYKSNNDACPSDGGKKALIELEYVAQADFVANNAKEKAGAASKADALKAGL